MFCVNYRTTPEILAFVAEVFYGGASNLKSGAYLAEISVFPCFNFVKSEGRECLDDHVATYYNEDEIYRTVEYVKMLYEAWPSCWGERSQEHIAVVTHYHGQVNSNYILSINMRKVCTLLFDIAMHSYK